VHREGVLLLGGGRALLMQIAHPAVALGVHRHSNFRRDGYGRLLRTLRLLMALVFGSQPQAEAAAASIRRAHAGVAGPGYNANDPSLQLWVWATIVDTAVVMHELMLRPLFEEESAAYYADMVAVAEVLGLRQVDLPLSLADLRRYVDTMSATVLVSPEARAISAELFRPRWLMWPLQQLTAGLLPPRMRAQLGLGWGDRRERALRLALRTARLCLPLVPLSLRSAPWFIMPPRQARAVAGR
jgi:uncharacterized protein (DUF2236 family)